MARDLAKRRLSNLAWNKRHRSSINAANRLRRLTLHGHAVVIAFHAHYEAKKYGVVNVLTTEQVFTVLRLSRGQCTYCRHIDDRLGIDHVIPMSRGGDNALVNVVACCLSCNHKKQGSPAPCMVQTLLL